MSLETGCGCRKKKPPNDKYRRRSGFGERKCGKKNEKKNEKNEKMKKKNEKDEKEKKRRGKKHQFYIP